jgi:hypothetical protein
VLTSSFIALGLVMTAAQQAEQRLTISVHDPRPLAEAVRTLEKRHGWIITYEDPPYVHPDDIADVTATVRKDYTPDKPKVLVPRGGTFEFGYTIPAGASEPDPAVVLEALVEEYNAQSASGRFRLARTRDVFHVIPSAFRAASGNLEPVSSLLDRKISLPARERTMYEFVSALVRAVAEPAGSKLLLGMFPMNFFLQRRVQDGAQDESARTVLVRALGSTGRKVSWTLYCGPAGSCALNFGLVQ